jgi:tetratricopeptide (TPR) repeat protein
MPVQRGVLSLVGRQREWETLQAAWRTATGGRPQFVLVGGEAGIGKTRLAEEMLAWAGQQGSAAAGTRAYAATTGLAYAPIVEWLRTPLLQKTLAQLDDVWLTELARLQPGLLVERPHLPRPEPLSERWQRQRLFEALVHAFFSQTSALLLVIDDLQWCDPETLEWLHYLLHYDPQAKLLVIGTVRSEEVGGNHPLMTLRLNLQHASLLTEIALGSLDIHETALLATQIAARALDSGVANRLYQATEGNPLFIVEMVRAFATDPIVSPKDKDEETITHAQTPPIRPLPAKVQAVIQSRLAQLSPASRDLANLAAVIGRFFTFEILSQASDHDEDTLVRGLDELWQRRIIREQGVNAYDFSHDRIREVAYAGISPAQRRLLHRNVAQALETIHNASLGAVGGQLAAHYEQGGLLEKALFYYQWAVKEAQQLDATQETIHHANKALAIIRFLPATIEHTRQQISMLLALVLTWGHVKGHTAPEIRQTLLQARALAQEIEDEFSLFLAQQWLWAVLAHSGEFRDAYELATNNLKLAQSSQNPVHLRTAHFIVGVSLFHLGKFAQAHEFYRQVMAIQVSQQAEAEDDSGTMLTVLARSALVLWMLGFAGQVDPLIDQALAQARKRYGPYSVCWMLRYGGLVCQFRRDVAAVYSYAQELVALGEKYGFPECISWGAILRGWVLTKRGEIAQGLALLRQHLAPMPAEGSFDMLPYYFALLAEAMDQAGEPGAGLHMLQDALAIAERTGCLFWNAELHRLRGQLLLAKDANLNEVEACFLQAIEVARQQGARILELRSSTSLARLWQQQGRQTDARQMLATIYNWFSEGFDTPDIRDAHLLLATLTR